MTKWKVVPIAVAMMLAVWCTGTFAQTDRSSPAQGGQAAELTARMEQAVDMMFRAMDANHDGKITRKEWLGFQGKQFDRLDKKSKGYITKKDVISVMMERMKEEQEQMRNGKGPGK